MRVSTVMSELGGERIDIIEWNDDASAFIKEALSPATPIEVVLDEAGHRARAGRRHELGRRRQVVRSGGDADLSLELVDDGGGHRPIGGCHPRMLSQRELNHGLRPAWGSASVIST